MDVLVLHMYYIGATKSATIQNALWNTRLERYNFPLKSPDPRITIGLENLQDETINSTKRFAPLTWYVARRPLPALKAVHLRLAEDLSIVCKLSLDTLETRR